MTFRLSIKKFVGNGGKAPCSSWMSVANGQCYALSPSKEPSLPVGSEVVPRARLVTAVKTSPSRESSLTYIHRSQSHYSFRKSPRNNRCWHHAAKGAKSFMYLHYYWL